MSQSRIIIKTGGWILLVVLNAGLRSCSHSFEGDTLDLRMYQWNLWIDPDATWSEKDDTSPLDNGSISPALLPSCGWEKLHRGMGKLVRIPTTISEHFPDTEDSVDTGAGFRGIAWYHCRFTLPKLWKEKTISLEFEEAGPRVDVFLNETYMGSRSGSHARFSLDVSNTIYHTRDNHLAIRISYLDATTGGIKGSIHAIPMDPPESPNPR